MDELDRRNRQRPRPVRIIVAGYLDQGDEPGLLKNLFEVFKRFVGHRVLDICNLKGVSSAWTNVGIATSFVPPVFKPLYAELHCLGYIMNQSCSRIQSMSQLYREDYDFKYLQIWGRCAKTLVKVRPGETVFMALKQRFDDSNQQVDHCVVQAAPSEFTTVPGSITDRVDLGYRQLFLYVMRHHREMIPGSTKMERRGRKKTAEGIHIPEEVDKLAWYRFAALADQLGFTSVAIASLKSMNEATTEVPSKQAKPSFITAGSGESEERRSGRPYDRAYKQSQSSLFLNNVHSTDQS